MLYEWLTQFADTYLFFNLFNYITFRTGGALLTSLVLTLAFGPMIIRWLKSKQGTGQPIRTDGPETHLAKQGTPTMGGIMILLSVVISGLLWADIKNPYIWIALGVFVGCGLVGFVDDYLKLTKKNTKGLSGKIRLFCQFSIAAAAAYFITYYSVDADLTTQLAVPFFKNFLINLGVLYIPFAMFVMVGSANAVNLTDGLDGLAIGTIMIATACFGVITYLAGNAVFAEYLQLHFVKNAGEISILCGALIGAGLGFLWYNAPPAEVFMGDTGSLAMGGFLGAVAVITKHEIVLAIIGGVFVLETVSVILQVASFKLRGKRIFLMAPIHHHFEKKGWAETKVVVRFWIIALILALIGLSTLKLR